MNPISHFAQCNRAPQFGKVSVAPNTDQRVAQFVKTHQDALDTVTADLSIILSTKRSLASLDAADLLCLTTLGKKAGQPIKKLNATTSIPGILNSTSKKPEIVAKQLQAFTTLFDGLREALQSIAKGKEPTNRSVVEYINEMLG